MLSYVCLWSYGWYWSIRSPAMFCTPIAESMDGSKLATYATRQAEVPTLQPGPVGWWLFSPMKSTPFLRDHLKGRPKKLKITNLQLIRSNRSVKRAKLRGGPGRDRKHHFDLFGWFQKARYCDSKPKPHIKPLWSESQKILCLHSHL